MRRPRSGLPSPRRPRSLRRGGRTRGAAAVLVSGGAGFVGTNLADRIAGQGRPVVIVDNLSRPGVEQNLAWLERGHGELIRFVRADVRNPHVWKTLLPDVTEVFHLAAQVAVTTSLHDPAADFDVNARGTLNLLEALRAMRDPPPVLFTSTNKVYGSLHDLDLRPTPRRYELADGVAGIAEDRPLDFRSPYGCSKGAADQYVLDYARSYDLPAVVFRMSCVYGPHQFGTEDQGWVAHFVRRAREGGGITLYGDGRQVRDVLFIGDLIEAMLLAQRRMSDLSGRPFNIGGGAENTVSLLELIDIIEEVQGHRPEIQLHEWRPGDQRYYSSDTRRFRRATGWAPRVGIREGVARLYRWLLAAERRDLPGYGRRAREFTRAAPRFAAGAS